MNIEKTRRDNLAKYITNTHKNRRQFALQYEFNYGNMHSMLKGTRAFGERIARELEAKLGLAAGFFDQEDIDLTKIPETKIPIYANKLSAGSGNRVFAEEIIGYHLLNPADLKNEGLEEKQLCIFFVRGDSMLPEIQDGAKVLVDVSQTKLIDNKIYAISIDNEIFIKKLFKEPGANKITIRSENKSYPDKIYNHAEELKIIGRVVYLLGKRL